MHSGYLANKDREVSEMQEYYDLEKNKVMNSISKLSLRVKNIEEALKTASNIKQYIQVFDDLYDVEFYGDAKRNIQYNR